MNTEMIRHVGYAPFGIKDIVAASGMSVNDYARAHGINPNTLAGWCAGKTCRAYVVAGLYIWDEYEKKQKRREKLSAI